MIDALIQGRVHRTPQARTSAKGTRYVTGNVRTATRDGAAVFVSVIAFSQSACDALLALEDGDSVGISGELTPKIYAPPNGEPRPSLDMVAHVVMSAYSVKRKREAMQPAAASQPQRAHDAGAVPFDDALPDCDGGAA